MQYVGYATYASKAQVLEGGVGVSFLRCGDLELGLGSDHFNDLLYERRTFIAIFIARSISV